MKKLTGILLLTFFSLWLVSNTIQAQNPADRSGYKVIAYMMGSSAREYPDSLISMLTHVNYAFAKVIGGEIAFASRNADHRKRINQSVSRVIGLKNKNPNLKVILSVGGWGAEGFSDAALTAESRRKFAVTGCKMIREYGFDGLDIDWEYPGQPGDGNVYRKEDKENFTLMLKALREELDKMGPDLLLTIASGADEEYFRWTDLGEAQKYLDFINVMSYDFYSGLSSVSGHHSNLTKTGYPGAISISTEIAVDRHIKAGVPAAKLVVGVPFYGRFWRGVPDTNHGLYQKASTTGQYKIYTEILDNYLNINTFTRYWDESAKAPYLYSKDSAMVISYEDPQSLALKAEYVKKNHLGGIMFWEYNGDKTGTLLESIYRNLKPEN